MAKKDEFELQALSTLRRPGDQVYSVTRTKKRNPLLEFLDVVVSGGAFTGAADVADSMATSLYLVAGRDRAVIARVSDGNVAETVDIPDWDGARAEALRGQAGALKAIVVDGYRYSKVAQDA